MGYPTDLTDKQWALIEPLIAKRTGNYHKKNWHCKRKIVNAILYLVKSGCQWRMLPKDFPPYSTVHTFYRRSRLNGLWEEILAVLVQKTRILDGRNPNPSYVLIDSQSVKTTGDAKERGIDGGKKS